VVRATVPAIRTKEAGGQLVQVNLYRRGQTGPDLDVIINQKQMQTHTIEISTDELLLIARVTGIILGCAVPDRYCDRRIVLAIFNRARQKL
jgi:hypothetical protein